MARTNSKASITNPYMAFKFNWPEFDRAFIENAKNHLELALNKGPRAHHICDDISVKELNFGTKVIHSVIGLSSYLLL